LDSKIEDKRKHRYKDHKYRYTAKLLLDVYHFVYVNTNRHMWAVNVSIVTVNITSG
jgi:DNA-binding sugar fermentation-stimulating protein